MQSFWKNLHPLLSRAEHDNRRTANGAVLHAIDGALTSAERKVLLDRPMESLATAQGFYLDYFGDWWGLPRHDKETDDHYRERMIHYLLLPRNTIPAITNAIKYYLQDKDHYVNVYEPWKNMFRIDNSKLDGEDHLQGNYYRYSVIDVGLDVPITQELLDYIYKFTPAGTTVYTNYNTLMGKGNGVTYLGTQDTLLETKINMELGSNYDSEAIKLGLDDYDKHKLQVSKLQPFILDNSKLDSSDVIKNPAADSYNADNLLLGTSDDEQVRQVGYKQEVEATEGTTYSFRGLINPDIRAVVSMNFLNSAGLTIKSVSSPEIRHNGKMSSIKGKGFTPVDLTGIAPAKARSVQIAVDNRSSVTDNLVKKSHATFHSAGKDNFPVSFDLASDLSEQKITTRVEFTVSNLKNSGSLVIVDGQDTDNWDTLVPLSATAKPPEETDKQGFKLDNSLLDNEDILVKANAGITPPQPITKNGKYVYTLTTTKHSLKPNTRTNRIFVKTDLDADIDLTVKLAVYVDTPMDMNYSVYKDEDGYYNAYKIKEFKLVSGENPNLHWTPAPSEVETPSPYYVDIINNTNVKLIERELRHTKQYNEYGAKLSFAKLHNRNIALKTGTPIVKQSVDKIEKLYMLSIPVEVDKTYTVLMNYASDDNNKDKRLVVTLENQNEEIMNTELYTHGDIKTYHGVYTAKKTGQYLNLSIKNGTASDLYILNFKLGVD